MGTLSASLNIVRRHRYTGPPAAAFLEERTDRMTRATLMCSAAVIALATLVSVWGCASEPGASATQQAAAAKQAAPHPEQALLEELVLANRMLARELAILDIQGHATVRSKINPNHYYIARFLSPGGLTTSDIIENDLDSKPVGGP